MKLRRICACILALLVVFCVISVRAATRLVVEGRNITYGNGEPVYVNTDFEPKETEFRAVWISAATNDIAGYTSEHSFKKQMYEVLDMMDYYNLNVMIYHVRIMNDALYKSEFNNWSSYYNTNPDWDSLPWLIEECHKRGIEFHAWMNPYRVSTNVSLSLEELAKRYPSKNAASNPENLLKASTVVILNPAEPEVRQFIIDTCMELVNNYDVDAIHFDDYFYAAGIDDSKALSKYKPSGVSVDEFRRLQVDEFIMNLSANLDRFNKKNNKSVQLGISPTGVYRNGTGEVTYKGTVPVTNGSKTGGYAHYGSPLYANTLKWIENEWIDYILPQTYHAITNSAAPYCELVGWWDKVMKYSNVNLYASMGYYMNGGSNNASWSYNKNEAFQQALFCNSLDNVKGMSIYSYKAYASGVSSSSNLSKLKDVWNRPIILPEIKTGNILEPGEITNLKVSQTSKGNKISFDALDSSKFYVIYRSKDPLTFSSVEVLDIIGNVNGEEIIEYVDNNNLEENYYYGVRPQSYSLKLGEGKMVSTEKMEESSQLSLGKIPGFGVSDNVLVGEKVTVYWDNMLYPFGGKINYSLTYSLYNKDEVIETKEVSTFTEVKNKNNVYFDIPNGCTKIKLRISAYNNIGETNEEYEFIVNSSIGKVMNFGVKEPQYFDKPLEFVWNALDLDCEYVIQYSSDSFTWEDVHKVVSRPNGLNYHEFINVSNRKGYYRIKALYNDDYSFSNVLYLSLSEYIGDYKGLLINGASVKMEYCFDENETFTLEWNKHSDDVVYSIVVSTNLIDWVNIRSYTNSVIDKSTTNKAKYEIKLSDKHHFIYLQVNGITDNGRNKTQIIQINVKKDYVFYDDVSYAQSDVINNALEKCSFFK